MTSALIIPAVGTVVLRDDGSVTFTDRNRATYEIAAEIVRVIVALAGEQPKEGPR